MKYSTAYAFRQALEQRIRRDYHGKEIPRIRKMIVFERLMARLDEKWILKGGYAIQLRTKKARTTQDVDILAAEIDIQEIESTLRFELEKEVGDYFEFFVTKQETVTDDGNSIRFTVTARVAGRIFERFHLDVGFSDTLYQPVDKLTPPNYLAFAEIEAHPILCYSIHQHIAEKVHAIWRPRKVQSSRVKDLVDLVLLAGLSSDISNNDLREAICLVFGDRGDQVPNSFLTFPSDWRQRYSRLAKEIDLHILDYQEAIQAVSKFISPVLSGDAAGMRWDSTAWKWD